MSWSFTAEEHTGHLRDALDEAFRQYLDGLGDATLAAEAKEQVDAATSAVMAIVTAKAVGEGPVQVSLAGHANPGHAPHPEFANDFIAIHISRTSDSVSVASAPDLVEPAAEPAPAPVAEPVAAEVPAPAPTEPEATEPVGEPAPETEAPAPEATPADPAAGAPAAS